MYFSNHTIRPWPNKKLRKAATILCFLFGQAESYFFGRIVRLPHIAKHPTDPISDYLVIANKVIRDQSGDNPSISQKGDANIAECSNPTGRAIVREKNSELLLMTYYPFHY
jgi:hypothetical protein